MVLSNGDPDMLERGVAPTSASRSTASSRSPRRALQAARRDLPQGRATSSGAAPDDVLFVANHAFDCVGAKAFGMRTAFVNRRGRPFGEKPYLPDLEVADFAALARVMA